MAQTTSCPGLHEITRVVRGEAGDPELGALVGHLLECSACREMLDPLGLGDSLVQRLDDARPQGAVDGDAVERLLARLRPARRTSGGESPMAGTLNSGGLAEPGRSLLPPGGAPEHIAAYRVLRRIGQGAMGTVFEALDPALGRRVALKVMNPALADQPGARDRFLREARAMAALKDDHIATVFQVGETDAGPFLAMELLAGESLQRNLARQGRLPVTEALRIAREAAQGLQAAHAQGLVHRDIKPANLWLEARPGSDRAEAGGRVKVLDFGLARAAAGHSGLTSAGHIVGTPCYMAPEQARAETVDHRADLFSLGCVLYQMLVDAQPFPGGSVMAVLLALATSEPEPLRRLRPDLPSGVCALVDRLMQKDPARRPQSAAEVVELIRGLEQQLDASRPVASSSRLRAAWIPARHAALAAAILVGLLTVRFLGRHASGDRAQAGVGPPAGPPIVVGVLHSRTGTMAASARPVIDATLLAIDEVNAGGGVLGRPVEAVIEDGQSDPEVYAKKTEKLLEENKVAAIFGCWTSAGRKAVRPIIERHDGLLFYPLQYEGLEQSPNIVYNGAAPNQQIIPALTWCCSYLKKQRLFLVGSDYVFPRAASAIIRDQARELGAEVVGEEYVPLGSLKMGELVRKIVAARPDVILNTINGDSNLAFFRALRAAGITPGRVPTVSFSLTEEELDHFSPRDVAGDYAAWNYFAGIDSAANREFVAKLRARLGLDRVPSDPMEAAYFGVHLWAEAVRRAGSADPAAVRGAVRGASFDAPEGPVKVDPETLHTHKHIRIGRVSDEGRFEVVYTSEQPIAPLPYPATRSVADWDALLNDLHLRWGGQWANPGR
jgi:urea transport system substrate-binding protein